MHHGAISDDRHLLPCPRHRGLADRDGIVSVRNLGGGMLGPGSDRAFVEAVERAVIDALGLEEDDRVGSSIAAISSPLASYGLDGITVLMPATWANKASGD
jgi:hypothetical protein